MQTLFASGSQTNGGKDGVDSEMPSSRAASWTSDQYYIHLL